jgi:hypothetical protein
MHLYHVAVRSKRCLEIANTEVTGGGGGSTLKQNTVIRVSRLFILCISLVFGGKYMEFRIIFSCTPLQHKHQYI